MLVEFLPCSSSRVVGLLESGANNLGFLFSMKEPAQYEVQLMLEHLEKDSPTSEVYEDRQQLK